MFRRFVGSDGCPFSFSHRRQSRRSFLSFRWREKTWKMNRSKVRTRISCRSRWTVGLKELRHFYGESSRDFSCSAVETAMSRIMLCGATEIVERFARGFVFNFINGLRCISTDSCFQFSQTGIVQSKACGDFVPVQWNSRILQFVEDIVSHVPIFLQGKDSIVWFYFVTCRYQYEPNVTIGVVS